MLYVIIGRDGPNAKELRPRIRPQHLEHLGAYDSAGRLRLAGPLTDGSGSLIVIEADSDDDARAIADSDPYTRAGVFESVEIHPFRQVLPSSPK